MPCFRLAVRTLSLPCADVGPADFPPCSRQRSRPFIAGHWQKPPFRLLAKQRLPVQSGPKRVPRPNSINSRVLTVFNISNWPVHGVVRSKLYMAPRLRGSNYVSLNLGPWCVDTGANAINLPTTSNCFLWHVDKTLVNGLPSASLTPLTKAFIYFPESGTIPL